MNAYSSEGPAWRLRRNRWQKNAADGISIPQSDPLESCLDDDDHDHDSISLCIGGHNVQSARLHQDSLVKRQAHIMVYSETELQEAEVFALQQNFRSQQWSVNLAARTSLTEAGNVGRRVAVAARDPIPLIELGFVGSDLLALADSGRWVESFVPVGDGNQFIIVAGFLRPFGRVFRQGFVQGQ